MPRRKINKGKCPMEGCTNQQVAKGLCMGHYGQQHRGEPLRPLRKPDSRPTMGVQMKPEARRELNAKAKAEGIAPSRLAGDLLAGLLLKRAS
jgi:hypothetical protein